MPRTGPVTTMIRWPPRLHTELESAARAEGVSVGQYVREAVVGRIAWQRARDEVDERELADVRAALRELARRVE